MTTILLARHGETDWNREHRWQGHADTELNAAGRAQARVLGDRLAGTHLDAVHASDLRRALETAEIAAGGRGLEIHADPALREIDDREWTGLTWPEIEARFPEGARRHRAGGTGWALGESWEAMAARVLDALARIARAHPGDTVLCVSHGGPVRAALAHADGVDLAEYRRSRPEPANGSLAELAVQDGTISRIH
jgi:probable phosphoglycerate mutase